MCAYIQAAHLTCLDTVLKKSAYNLERILKFASLANLKMAVTDNQLVDNECFLDFFYIIGTKPGAKEFFQEIFKEKNLIVIYEPKNKTFENALNARVNRAKKGNFLFSALSQENNQWVNKSKPSLDAFCDQFQKYKEWITFLDAQKPEKMEYKFGDFSPLVIERYNALSNNLTETVKKTVGVFLERNSTFNRSQIYNYLDSKKKLEENCKTAIKRVLIDDIYNWNQCSSNNLKLLIQDYDQNWLEHLFTDVNEYIPSGAELESDYIKVDQISVPIDSITFEDILKIRENVKKPLEELSRSHIGKWEENAIAYRHSLMEALKRIGTISTAVELNQYKARKIRKVCTFVGCLGGAIIGKLVGSDSWLASSSSIGAMKGYMSANVIVNILSEKNWINFEQNISKAMNVSKPNPNS